MNRRRFLRAIGVGAASVVAAPVLEFVPLPAPVVIPVRKVVSRIRATKEVIDEHAFEKYWMRNVAYFKGRQW